MPALVAVSLAGFSGYAALLAVAPAWVVRGGASEAGAGLVNGVLLAATVATQLLVPRLLRAFGTAPVLAASLLFLGLAAPAYALSDALGPVLAWSSVRGVGFGILTVVGSTVVAHLVPPGRRGEAVGVYGLAVAAPMLVLLPGSVAIADRFGYGWAFAAGSLPLLGVPWAVSLGRRVDGSVSAAAVRDPHHHGDHHGDHLGDHLGDHRTAPAHPSGRTLSLVWRPTVVLFAVTMAGGALVTFAPQLGLGGLWAAGALLALSLASALSRWLVGRLADRHGAGQFVAPLLLVCAVGMTLCAVAVARDRPWLLLLGALVVGPPYGALQNLTLVLAFERVPAPALPTASAIWNIGFDAGTATGSVVVGALAAAYSFGTAFATMGVVVLAVLVLTPRSRARPAIPAPSEG